MTKKKKTEGNSNTAVKTIDKNEVEEMFENGELDSSVNELLEEQKEHEDQETKEAKQKLEQEQMTDEELIYNLINTPGHKFQINFDVLFEKEQAFFDKLDEDTVQRLINNVASKKSRSKAQGKHAEVHKMETIDYKLKKTRKASSKKPSGIDPTTKEIQAVNTVEEINRMIKNVQSKKCLAKGMQKEERYKELMELEEEMVAHRNELKGTSGRIRPPRELEEALNELKNIDEKDQTDEIKGQIKALEYVLKFDEEQ